METAAGSQTIFVIRHGEKPHGKQHGIDHDGNPNEHSLTPKGWQRAGALIHLFTPANPGFAQPERLFAPLYPSISAADPAPDPSDYRTHQTILPLAHFRGLTIESPYAVDDAERLGAELAKTGAGVTLVCWEHQKIPLLARKIAPQASIPAKWPDHRFDMVWCFARSPAANPAFDFQQLPEMLLPGDSDKTFS